MDMATISRFEELICWQKAREFDKLIFQLTQHTGFSKDFSLLDQIRRASGSVMDNIAEGFEREGNKEFLNFLSIAKGSAAEVRSQLYRALDRNYLNQADFDKATKVNQEVIRLIRSLMTYLKSSEIKGSKYKVGEPTSPYVSTYQTLIDKTFSFPDQFIGDYH